MATFHPDDTRLDGWLKAASSYLALADVATARLDALVLLEDQLGIDRSQLLAHPDQELSKQNINVLNRQIAQRGRHTPLAYIRRKTEFYGREFIISSAVLEPRPESETMIDLLKQLVFPGQSQTDIHKSPALKVSSALPIVQAAKKTFKASSAHVLCTIADVGTGCGALGITAELELPNSSVDLLEIDAGARKVAKMNVIKHTTSISVINSDLLRQAPRQYDVLLCNLPYIPDNFHINTAATHEPSLAIFGGPDGLNLYRRLFKELHYLQQSPLYILTESLPTQHSDLVDIAGKNGYSLFTSSDFIQVFSPNR